MASSKDPEPKIEHPRRQPGDPVLVRDKYVKKMQQDLRDEGINPNWWGSKDWVRIYYYKKNPPPPWMKFSDSHQHRNITDRDFRIMAAGELSLDICEMLTHLRVVPSPNHIQKVFNDNQFDIFRHMMRCMMIHYTTNNT